MAGFIQQQTQGSYVQALTALVDASGPGGSVVIGTANVLYQIAALVPQSWSSDILATAGSLILSPGTSGFRVKDAVPGTHATVSCYLAGKNEPLAQVTGTNLAAAPPSNMITGIIPAAGTTPTAGSGFTYTNDGAGTYVFTFTTAFASTPDVLACIIDDSNSIVRISAVAASGFTIKTANISPLALAAHSFNFIAQAVL